MRVDVGAVFGIVAVELLVLVARRFAPRNPLVEALGVGAVLFDQPAQDAAQARRDRGRRGSVLDLRDRPGLLQGGGKCDRAREAGGEPVEPFLAGRTLLADGAVIGLPRQPRLEPVSQPLAPSALEVGEQISAQAIGLSAHDARHR